jgi:hypothetical protein
MIQPKINYIGQVSRPSKKPLQMNSEVIKTMFGNGFKKYSLFKTKNTFFLKHLQEIHFSKHNTPFSKKKNFRKIFTPYKSILRKWVLTFSSVGVDLLLINIYI